MNSSNAAKKILLITIVLLNAHQINLFTMKVLKKYLSWERFFESFNKRNNLDASTNTIRIADGFEETNCTIDLLDSKIYNHEHQTELSAKEFQYLMSLKTYIPEKFSMFLKYMKSVKFKLWTLSDLDISTFTEFSVNNESHDLKQVWLKGKPLKIIIHGWLENDKNEKGVFGIKRAYIEKKGEYNVVTVNWGKYANIINYFSAAESSKIVGHIIAHVLVNMTNDHMVTQDTIHLIGHSLGSHVAGVAGRIYHNLTSELIWRITGLDPPYPNFIEGSSCILFWTVYDRLDQTDAKFVDVIKTTKETLGIPFKIGHAEFHPNNGGSNQPGCESYLPIMNWICSHDRSYEYYRESVEMSKPGECTTFESKRCDSMADFIAGLCKDAPSSYMGHCAVYGLDGDFFLITNRKKPFSRPLPQWP